jgi:hypothetical protein
MDLDAAEADGGRFFVDVSDPNLALVERPALSPLPAVGPAPLVLGGDWPAGSSVRIVDADGLVTAYTHDPADLLRLVDPGSYRVVVTPPFPTRAVRGRVRVA